MVDEQQYGEDFWGGSATMLKPGDPMGTKDTMLTIKEGKHG